VDVWMLVVGALLLAVVAYDAAAATIATGTTDGPLTLRIGRTWWTVAHKAARTPESRILTSAGPLILVTTIVVWLVLMWLGWTLIFAADPSAVVSSTAREPADWFARAYFAGFTTFTLGVGDFVPVGAVWQLLTVLATISGLALTTTAITYLVPVVGAVTDRRKQAAFISALGGQAHRIVVAAYDGGSVAYLETVLQQLTQSLILTAERHLAYPVLHFFHPPSAVTELRVQLAALDDALTLIQHGLAPDVGRPHPDAISGARAAVAQLLQRARATVGPEAQPLDLGPLRQAGIATVDDATFRDRIATLQEHRSQVAAYLAESHWRRAGSEPQS
jgi:hypothetical protein